MRLICRHGHAASERFVLLCPRPVHGLAPTLPRTYRDAPPWTRSKAKCLPSASRRLRAALTPADTSVWSRTSRRCARTPRRSALTLQLAALANQLSLTQPALLEHLRPLEQRLGLVFTLLKASVWATFVEREAQREAETDEAARSGGDSSDDSR